MAVSLPNPQSYQGWLSNYQVLRGAGTTPDTEWWILGRGSFGVVYRAHDVKGAKDVAIKCIQLDLCTTSKQRGRLVSEATNHYKLRHSSIVRCREVFITCYHMAIVMDLAEGHDLGKLFEIYRKPLAENSARWIFQQLIVAVNYCHSQEVYHRDIKLDNVLMYRGEDARPLVMLCDFGLSRAYWNPKPVFLPGAIPCRSPEGFRKQIDYAAQLADVWSCGVVLYNMLFMKFPFGDNGCDRALDSHFALTIPPDTVSSKVSLDCRDLLQRIFCAPAQRLNMAAVMGHQWYKTDRPTAVDLPLDPPTQQELDVIQEYVSSELLRAFTRQPGVGSRDMPASQPLEVD